MENLGINVSLKHYKKYELDRYTELIKNLGAEWVRIEFDFYNDDPKKDEAFDYLITKLHENGIKMLGVLAGIVPATLMALMNSSVKFRNPLDVLDKYLVFVKDHCERYKGKIKHWQVWNEVNLRRFWMRKANPDEYFELLKATIPVIKDIDADNKIVSGPICGDDVKFLFFGFEINYLSTLMDKGLADYVDIIAFHPYIASNYIGFASIKTMERRLHERIDTFLNKYTQSGKEIWITELGITKYTVLREKRSTEDIGDLYISVLDKTLNKGIKTFLWVLTDFKDKYYSFFNPEPHFGLTDFDLNEKDNYFKVKDYIENFDSKG